MHGPTFKYRHWTGKQRKPTGAVQFLRLKSFNKTHLIARHNNGKLNVVFYVRFILRWGDFSRCSSERLCNNLQRTYQRIYLASVSISLQQKATSRLFLCMRYFLVVSQTPRRWCDVMRSKLSSCHCELKLLVSRNTILQAVHENPNSGQ